MQRIHRSRSFAPALNPLEGRLLLSVAPGKAAIHGGPLILPTQTEVTMTDQLIYNNHHKLTSVELTATVKPVSGSGVPTGFVTFSTLKMVNKVLEPGGKAIANLTLSSGSATVTVNAKQVLKKPVDVVYRGDSNFEPTNSIPAEVTKAGLKVVPIDGARA
jgi:hypothetical protein